MLASLQKAKSKYFVFTSEMILPIVIVVGVVGLWYVSFRTSLFAITTIVCTVDYKPCGDSSLHAELDKVKGSNILTVDLPGVARRLTSGDFTIRDVTFSRQLPHTLVADMQSVYPVAALQITGGNEWAVLDSRNRYIGITRTNPNVPVVLVTSLPPVQIGQAVTDGAILSAVSAAKTIADSLPGAQSVLLTDDTLTVALHDGKKAIFSITKDLDEQIRTLQVVLSDTTMIKEVEVVDVRFSRPVIK